MLGSYEQRFCQRLAQFAWSNMTKKRIARANADAISEIEGYSVLIKDWLGKRQTKSRILAF
jgi:hypothetical protein